jgi:hypothetical protein
LQKVHSDDEFEKVSPDNEFRKSVRQEFIPVKDMWVNFPNFGSLNGGRESLQETFMLEFCSPPSTFCSRPAAMPKLSLRMLSNAA